MIEPAYYGQLRPEVAERVPRGSKRILDVGCGTGMLGGSLKERQGAEVWGVEPVAGAACEAEKRIDRVFEATVEAALPEIPVGYFDCIITADVLEHVVDPWAVLAELVRRLAPGGCIVASVPNVGHWSVLRDLMLGDWRYASEGLLDRTHLRFFTRRSVEELFWNAGLRVSAIDEIRYGTTAPARIAGALEAQGFDASAVARDGGVLQYLVTAQRAPAIEPPPKVAVVVLGWNRRDDTLACLSSLAELGVPGLELIAVDNGSEDGSVEAVRELHPDVRLVCNERNLGYAGGNNRGLEAAEEAGAEFALLLNNDARPEPGLVEELVRVARLVPDAAFVGALAVLEDDPTRIWSAGGRWSPERHRFTSIGWSEEADRIEHASIREVDFGTGCALLVRMETYRAIGGMDEAFFLTWEEADWAERARAQGWRSITAPAARVRHGVSASFGGGGSPLHCYFMIRNGMLYARKHLPRRMRFSVYRDAIADLWSDLVPPWKRKVGLRRNLMEVHAWWGRLRERSRAPTTQAKFFALCDFGLGRLGPGSPRIWALNESWKAGRGRRHEPIL